MPGITAVGVSNKLPLAGEGGNNLLALEGVNPPMSERPLADIRRVNPDYFRTMGIPLRTGRIFAESDRERKVALVSAITAERLWPGQSPIGKRFREGGDQSPLLEVLGIVGDIRGISLNRGPSLTVYLPYWQRFFNQASLVVKTTADPLAAASAIRAVIRQVDPELPLQTFQTMDDIVTESVAQRRFQMNLVLLFAVAALLLASLGIHGVVSYSVTQRTNEMGIRMALGATQGDIRGMVLGQGLAPVAIGLAIGALASLGLDRVLGSLIFGVSAHDPLTFASVALVLALVAALASYLPARRATRVDPLTALRYE